jgi:hypothetical protein
MLPKLTAYHGAKSSYSSARFWKHREYEASLGCILMLAILIMKLIIK